MTNLEQLYLNKSNIPKRYLRDISLIPSTQDLKTFEELNDIKNNIVNFVDEGKNLLIYSSHVGNGKSTWAIKMMKEYINKVKDTYINCPAFFINVNDFLMEKKLAIENASKKSYTTDVENKILSSNLVVFDDLGVKNISEYDLGNLYYWINTRTNQLKSSIYTSNLVPERLRSLLDDRLYSRIVNYSILKEIKDGDSRNVGEFRC